MRTVIQRLRKGAAVIVFPEGTRTSSGQLGDMKKGFALLAKRAAVPIAPVAIVGAYECWPRFHLLPRPGRIRLHFGAVITADEVNRLSETQLAERCIATLRDLCLAYKSCTDRNVASFITVLTSVFLPTILKALFR
jgi:1-acyl-sn-glycerol-3-phosphate acyltransferase